MITSEFEKNEKQLDLETMLDKLQDEVADLRAENAELKLTVEMERIHRVGRETEKGRIDFTDGEVLRDEPHLMEEYKAATARMNEYFQIQCDKLDAPE
tara:strand:- start:743 stop:1036 length:294 start_codon:yes stop_codon:yes gene_type:complete